MKLAKVTLQQKIQLKQFEIELHIQNKAFHQIDRYEICLRRLNNDLIILKNQLSTRENRKTIKHELGYSRIGLNNV